MGPGIRGYDYGYNAPTEVSVAPAISSEIVQSVVGLFSLPRVLFLPLLAPLSHVLSLVPLSHVLSLSLARQV